MRTTIENAQHNPPQQPLIPAESQAAARHAPLGPEHMLALNEGRRRGRGVRRAVAVARFSGWSMAIFAVIALLTVLLGDYVSLVLGLALGGAAWNELRGGGQLANFDAKGASRLGYNQIIVGVIIISYAGWSLSSVTRSEAYAQLRQSTGDAGMDAMLSDLMSTMSYGVYGGMAALGVIVPGLTAWYYFSRGRIVRELVKTTPKWVLDAMRALG